MTITVQDLLDELGNRAWSGFNKDDMVFGTEEAFTALAELNAAHRYLMASRDFPFKVLSDEIITSSNISQYPMIEGQVTEIVNKKTLQKLSQIQDWNALPEAVGEPDSFWISFSNPDASIVLYPTPDKTYNFSVIYNTYKFILDKKGNQLYKFTNVDDYLNLPSYLEYLYADCLVLRTMATNNKDEQDENYRPILQEFAEAWRNFIHAANPVDMEQRIVI